MSSKSNVELPISPLPTQHSSPASEGDKKATQDHKSSPTVDELFLEGLKWYAKAHYPQAMKLFKQAAEKKHVSAWLYIGHMYEHGKGVTQDKNEALSWYTDANFQKALLDDWAENGNAIQQL